MSRKWKPGDVAMVNRLGNWVPAVKCAPDKTWPDGWYTAHGEAIYEGSEVRPLVVIDPEDREQVERLVNSVLAPINDTVLSLGLDIAQKCLREFADPKPPKPEEPTGDGAVVEDRMGHRWVRIAGPEAEIDSKPWRHRGHKARTWEHVTAVRVLSEGVQS